MKSESRNERESKTRRPFFFSVERLMMRQSLTPARLGRFPASRPRQARSVTVAGSHVSFSGARPRAKPVWRTEERL